MSKNTNREEYNAYMKEYILRRYHRRREERKAKLKEERNKAAGNS